MCQSDEANYSLYQKYVQLWVEDGQSQVKMTQQIAKNTKKLWMERENLKQYHARAVALQAKITHLQAAVQEQLRHHQ